jgi:hypothetical protein
MSNKKGAAVADKPQAPGNGALVPAQAVGGEHKALATGGAKVRGLEEMTPKDILIPTVVLVQNNSYYTNELRKEAGTFVDSVTKEVLEKVVVIPVKLRKYWDLLKLEGNKMIFENRIYDERDERLRGRRFFPEKDDKGNRIPSDVDSVMSFLSLINGKLYNVAFKKTSYKTGKKLCKLIQDTRKDTFAGKYTLLANKTSNASGTFYVMDVEFAGETSAQEFALAETAYDQFSAVELARSEGETEESVPF